MGLVVQPGLTQGEYHHAPCLRYPAVQPTCRKATPPRPGRPQHASGMGRCGGASQVVAGAGDSARPRPRRTGDQNRTEKSNVMRLSMMSSSSSVSANSYTRPIS